jgi:nitrite reductase/ring-hydroxylating ferredoxin subunit
MTAESSSTSSETSTLLDGRSTSKSTKPELSHPSFDHGPWKHVGTVRDLPVRTQLVVDGRHITLLRIARGGVLEWTAFDSLCYHAGGALGQAGKLSVVAGRACLTCPVHLFVLDIFNGERIRKDTVREEHELRGKTTETGCIGDDELDSGHRKEPTSKGPELMNEIKQRVHDVKVRDGRVWVRLQTKFPLRADSDRWAFRSTAFFGSNIEW